MIFQPFFFNALMALTSLAWLPVILFRNHEVFAVGMSMPETALPLPAGMNKDDGFVFRQYNVRLTGEFFIVKSVTEALCM